MAVGWGCVFGVVVRNVGGAAVAGPVEVSLGTSGQRSGALTASGTGWSCPGSTCVYSGGVAAGSALPDLVVRQGTSWDYPSASYVSLSATVAQSGDGVIQNNSASAQVPIVQASGGDVVVGVSPVGPVAVVRSGV